MSEDGFPGDESTIEAWRLPWPGNMVLLRLGPETPHVAGHLAAEYTVTHRVGCVCPECQELRAAVGNMRGRNQHIAAVMNARERGLNQAGQEIRAQRHREGTARSQVNRELAEAGADPYRSGGPDLPAGRKACGCLKHVACLCRDSWGRTRAVAEAQPDYAEKRRAMQADLDNGVCTYTTPVRYAFRIGEYAATGYKHGETTGRPPLFAILGVDTPASRGEVPAPSDRSEEPAPDPEQEVLAALREYDSWVLAGPQFPPALTGIRPAGMCTDCWLAPGAVDGRCFWCQLKVTVARENRSREPERKHRTGPGIAVKALIVVATAFWVLCLVSAVLTLAGVLS